MIGLVMAGGKGSRMKTDGEKLLLNYKKPIVMHVIDALTDSACFERVVAVTSPNSPRTRDYLKDNNVEILESRGEGYSKDLNRVLQQADDHVLVAPGDLPFLDGAIIRGMVARYDPNDTWTSFVATRGYSESLGLAPEFSVALEGHDECIYTGVSLINAKNISDEGPVKESYVVLDDKRVAFNLNTGRDYELLLGTA